MKFTTLVASLALLFASVAHAQTYTCTGSVPGSLSCAAVPVPVPPASAPVPTPAPAPVPMPPVVDHSGMGPTIDPKLIPAPAVGYSGPRVKTTFLDMTKWTDAAGNPAPTCTGWSANCFKGVPNPTCTAPSPTTAPPTCVQQAAYAVTPATAPAGKFTVGAFRDSCAFAKMAFDDPIVLPGQPGGSHLHTFGGNAGVDAFSTVESISTQGNSTCDGGTLNRSSYWFPSMIDTGIGKPLVPFTRNADGSIGNGIVVYYKGSFDFDSSAIVQALPAGLRMVSGNAKNTDPLHTGARYSCTGTAGTSSWFPTITSASASPLCRSGADFIMEVPFPYCWDGVNLDSPNHASHLSGPVEDATGKHCPADHPKTLPVVTFNAHYLITDDQAVSRWRLSSDMDPTLPAGITGHGDYFMGWDKETMQSWVDGCIRAKFDCHADLLGDGRTLY